MNKRIFTAIATLSLCISTFAQTLETDSDLIIMREELNYNMEQLRQKPVPAYFMSLRLIDDSKLEIGSTSGAGGVNQSHNRYVVPNVRVSNMDLDNYKFINQDDYIRYSRSAEDNQVSIYGCFPKLLREKIWLATNRRYTTALERYETAKTKSKTEANYEDSAACFSEAPVESYYEPALPPLKVDTATWLRRMDKISSVFKKCPALELGMAGITFTTTRTYIVNTDGTSVAQNRRCVRIMLQASIKASDGMTCPLSKDFFAFNEEDLPDDSVLIATAEDITNRLILLRDAPLADPYTGPAILSGPASGVFFHEIFGHRLESHRMKKGGETFKHMVGQRVLPLTFSVYCDPTMPYFGKQALNGYYKYDEEGVKAQRVTNVENGILKNFLSGRIPIDGFYHSNGHGRAVMGNDPVSRQSNLIVETSHPYTDAQLREMLIKEAKKQGKEYGYFFRTVTSGFTNTEDLNVFDVEPLEVYRVYVDGRNDELVRGVSLIGTPLSMFSNIEAGGDTPVTFTGYCGAESGWVPVTATSPYIYVSKIETQRSPQTKSVPRILPRPAYTTDQSINDASSDEKVQHLIFKALEDEMARTKDSLKLDDSPLPYFVDYRFIHGTNTGVEASLGAITMCYSEKGQNLCYVNMIIGDSIVSDKGYTDYNGQVTWTTEELDYDIIRNQLWLMTDAKYKSCIGDYGTKLHKLKESPLPEEDCNIPDFFPVQAREYIEPTAITELPDTVEMKKMISELSTVFADYPQLYSSRVNCTVTTLDIYRLTSTGLRLRQPSKYALITASCRVRAADGSYISDNLEFVAPELSDIESTDKLKQRIKDFCELFIKKSNAPIVKEYYVGPLMIDGASVCNIMYNKVVSNNCLAERHPTHGSSTNYMKIGKRIIDTKISIHQLTDTPEYNGVKILGNYRVDMNGVTPLKDLAIVDKGIQKVLLTGESPALGAMLQTGNLRQRPSSTSFALAPGTLHVTADHAMAYDKMKSLFIKEAKKSGLDHAYIIRTPEGGNSYLVRLDLNTGAEEIVRASGIPMPGRSDLMHITAASKEEIVTNHIYKSEIAVIAPKAIIVDNIEYTFDKPDIHKDFELTNPALRNSGANAFK